MTDKKISKSHHSDIGAFLKHVAQTPLVKTSGKRGRLVFAMDATASRAASWDQACQIQGEMFQQTASLGGLEIQLCFYRGFAEFHASPWYTGSADLLKCMSAVRCLGGHTQIVRLIRHTIVETKRQKVDALVFVGDCMEESVDDLCQLGGELSLLGVPMFLFHEGGESTAAMAFRQLAQITNGAYSPFDANSAQQLKELLSAVAVYAAGGRKALDNFNKRKGRAVLKLTRQRQR
ncbi:MAG: VWA domain-containing protein [Gammaproteobacteria bacterium]|nr:VWA domain-containing protein [Gammaproteobacteria bacterium]